MLARPFAGKWSTLEVVCHLADFEIVFADRIKRVIAENNPTMFGGNPDEFAARLAYHQRDAEEELVLIEHIRKQVARILAEPSARSVSASRHPFRIRPNDAGGPGGAHHRAHSAPPSLCPREAESIGLGGNVRATRSTHLGQ